MHNICLYYENKKPVQSKNLTYIITKYYLILPIFIRYNISFYQITNTK